MPRAVPEPSTLALPVHDAASFSFHFSLPSFALTA